MDNSRTNVKVAAAAEVGWEDGKIVGTPVPLSPVGIEKLLGQGLSNKDEFLSTVTDYPPYTELWKVQRGDQPVRHYLVELATEAPQMHAVEAVTTTASGVEEGFNSELSGGLGGDEWRSPSLTEDEQLVGIDVSGGDWIDSITVHIRSNASDTVTSQTFGGNGGEHLLSFGVPETGRLIRVSGTYGWYVNSLDFVVSDPQSGETNTYSAHGQDVGPETFEYEAPDGSEIAELWGRSGWYLDAIGVNYRPVNHPQP
jgi:Jacalin-like lectin domain